MMPKCGECIHYEVCELYVSPNESFPEVEGGCGLFKSTADVIEVVRCKDCVKRDTGECAMSYECSCGGQWSWEVDNGFCVFGERKSQE